MDGHRASGPLSRALYFLSQGVARTPAPPTPPGVRCSRRLPGGMAGIGPDATAAIWYRALTTYLMLGSDYVHARESAMRAVTVSLTMEATEANSSVFTVDSLSLLGMQGTSEIKR
jgi:Zn-dependent metalloprotease